VVSTSSSMLVESVEKASRTPDGIRTLIPMAWGTWGLVQAGSLLGPISLLKIGASGRSKR
jgi:hypothetical protein